MLSYRHAFHVGNHADVLKHMVLIQVMSHAILKDKPLWYIDTHAGAGIYALDKGYSTQIAEFKEGIGRLWDADNLPELLSDYIHAVRQFNPDGILRRYPGSPILAHYKLRPNDRLRLFELHPNDYQFLQQSFRTINANPRQLLLKAEDGFTGIKSLLPPPPRRAVILIDPPYEDKKDYQRVVDMLDDSLRRFATGTYIIWYPVLQRPEPRQMLTKLKKLPMESWVHVNLTVKSPSIDGFGMRGSGLFVINPPYTLPGKLEESMPNLAKLLAVDQSSAYGLEYQIN